MKYVEEEALLKELLSLEAELSPKLKRIGEIKSWCKERGSFSTEHYVCSVKEKTQVRMVGLEKTVAALGMEMLEAFKLIQTVTFNIVSVSEKPSKIDTITINLE